MARCNRTFVGHRVRFGGPLYICTNKKQNIQRNIFSCIGIKFLVHMRTQEQLQNILIHHQKLNI